MKVTFNAINTQINLMISKKNFHFALLINLGYVLITYLFYVWKNIGGEVSTIPSPSAVFSLQSTSPFFDMYINIVPFIAVIPFAMSYMDDKNNSILPILQIRSGVKQYYLSKGIACFVGAFLAFFLPLIISIFLNEITFPQSGITFIGDLYDMNFDARIVGNNILRETKWGGMWFPRLFLFNQQLYNAVFAFIFSIAMSFLSVFVYMLSFLVSKQKLLLLLPLYLIIITLNTLDLFLESNTPYMCYKIMQYITVNTMSGKNPLFIDVVFGSAIVISSLLYYRQISKDQMN